MNPTCPCGLPRPYPDCCGRYHAGAAAPDAESLMRARYTAFTLSLRDFLLATWHPDTRPAELDLDSPTPKWLGLKVTDHRPLDDAHAEVEFVARFKIAGRAIRQHERSRFEKIMGRWYYLDGTPPDALLGQGAPNRTPP